MDITKQYLNIGYLDSLSLRDTLFHRIDPRVKLVVTAVFVMSVVSFPKYSLSGLMPFFLYPALIIVFGDIPAGYVLRKVVLLSPFAVFIGMFNPVIDRDTAMTLAGISVSGGWISFLSILVKFVLTVSTALLLIATSSFAGLCESLRRLRFPEAYVVQLYFLYRYLFVLLEEVYRMVRAREARSFGKRGYGIKPFMNLLSVLLMRTLQRADRIYGAMMARGYSGKMGLAGTFRVRASDIMFALIFTGLFVLFRIADVPHVLGRLLMGGMV